MRQLQEAPPRAMRPTVSPLPPPSHVGNGERGLSCCMHWAQAAEETPDNFCACDCFALELCSSCLRSLLAHRGDPRAVTLRGQHPGLVCSTQQEGLQDTAALGPDPHPLPCCSERPLTHGQQLLVGVDPVVVLRGWKKRRSITQCLLQAQPATRTERGQHRGQTWGPILAPQGAAALGQRSAPAPTLAMPIARTLLPHSTAAPMGRAMPPAPPAPCIPPPPSRRIAGAVPKALAIAMVSTRPMSGTTASPTPMSWRGGQRAL